MFDFLKRVLFSILGMTALLVLVSIWNGEEMDWTIISGIGGIVLTGLVIKLGLDLYK
ncbi:hypothetical protein [Sediminibacillus massiliensis]|uniref:hypothetical protein n=1 Tax=Sediminibacillus massiliensis TaxID=1926277 RepID=UPI0015C2DA9F|nr:hypothetical protein [Sediminibacillus massiliensis]